MSVTDGFAEIGAMLQQQRQYTVALEEENKLLRERLETLLRGVGVTVTIANPENGEEQQFYLAPQRPIDANNLRILGAVPEMKKQLEGSFLLDQGTKDHIEKLVS